MSWTTYEGGVVVERGDDATQTVSKYDPTGQVIGTRPYTAEEIARLQPGLDADAARGNESQITTRLSETLAELQTLIDTGPATINAGPAPYIKALARAIRLLIRIVLRRFDGSS